MASDPWTSLELLSRYRTGDETAAGQLFERYMVRLTALARARLSSRLAARTDPEDVVMSAWRSFFVAARDGRFELGRGGDLWRLLVQITMHKLHHQVRRHTASSRTVNAEQPLETVKPAQAPLDRSPGPEEALAVAEQLEHLLAGLDALGRRVLELRLQGEQLQAIAAETGSSERTVRRILAEVRKRMAQQIGLEAGEPAADVEDAPPRATSPQRAPRKPLDARAPLAYADFQLQRLIGSGRVGKVYRAWQTSANRFVAVKHLRKSFLQHGDVVARFVAESQIVGRMSHPGIVGVHGLGRTPGGGYFIAMELVVGIDLARLMAQGPLPIADALRWVCQACGAIEHAHALGIVHCDLKPANLLLGSDGRIRVTDFGLARLRLDDRSADERIEGTAPFMAPEQVSSIWGSIGPRTDVYGLGAVLYTLLTGHAPWRGQRVADVLAQVVSAACASDPRSLRPDVTNEVSEICRRCLAKDPARRYPTAQGLSAALSRTDSSCGN